MNMIKYVLLVFIMLALSATSVKSQTKTDTIVQLKFPNEAVIAVDNLNVLYIGLENPISVSVPGEKLEDITISCSDGADVRMVSFGHYIAVAYPKAEDIYITTMVKGRVRGYTHFRAKTLPKYYAQLGNLASGKASLNDILKQDTVFAGFAVEAPFEGRNYTVNKFTLVYTPTSKLHIPSDSAQTGYFTVAGQTITPRIKEYISKAKSGDIIQISNFEIVGLSNNIPMHIPASIIIIIE